MLISEFKFQNRFSNNMEIQIDKVDKSGEWSNIITTKKNEFSFLLSVDDIGSIIIDTNETPSYTIDLEEYNRLYEITLMSDYYDLPFISIKRS
jgi:hypothetical protein